MDKGCRITQSRCRTAQSSGSVIRDMCRTAQGRARMTQGGCRKGQASCRIGQSGCEIRSRRRQNSPQTRHFRTYLLLLLIEHQQLAINALNPTVFVKIPGFVDLFPRARASGWTGEWPSPGCKSSRCSRGGGARLCPRDQPQQPGTGQGVRTFPRHLPGRTCCGWHSAHSRAPPGEWPSSATGTSTSPQAWEFLQTGWSSGVSVPVTGPLRRSP